ncbi:DUF4433 domain-containing protein [Pandoraea sp.]|uniref:DUF4433 domain-containing protein n=1 Tax=Pandoraea sp. TaxID=1883445 RepID=UPI0035B070B8
MPIENLPSVAKHGLVSYERAAKLPHRSVALQPVQDRRDIISVPQGLRLHQYANMYFHARNPMLFKRLGEADSLCILRISTDVFDIPRTVITDQNAASKYVRFYAPNQWRNLDFDRIYAENWQDPNEIQYWQKKSAKCAEILVEKFVPPNLIFSAFVRSKKSRDLFESMETDIHSEINGYMFFE